MTKLLDEAMELARTFPPDLQDEVARWVLSLPIGDDEPIALTPEEDAAIAVSLEAADRGDFATDAQLRAFQAKHGL